MFRYLRHRLRGFKNAGLLLLWSALMAGPAWGLGLGDIKLDSALNEPLDATIELSDVQGVQADEIKVSLASPQDFQRVGVERFFFLTDLRFEVAGAAGGARSVRVRSTQPITEPYVNFLVEVLWPGGRMLKEYTLLLDPPTFTPAPAPAVAAPAVAAAATGLQADAGTAPARASEPAPLAEPASPSGGMAVTMPAAAPGLTPPLDRGVAEGEYRMTDRTDTLWSIASRARPSRAVSINQTMLALQRLNPDAFLHGNINLLKSGHSLKLPSESEALAISETEAAQLVAAQTERWRALSRGEGARIAQPAGEPALRDADLQSPVDATPARAPAPGPVEQAGGELRIVAAAGDGVAGGGPAAEPDERLALNLEELDRLSREVEDLNSALAREKELASAQLAVKDRQIEVRDQQLAQLQAELDNIRRQLTPAQTQNQSAAGPAQAWWQSPYVVGGITGLVVLLLAYILVGARRRQAVTAPYAEPTVRAAEPRSTEAVAGVAPVLAVAADEPLSVDQHREPADVTTVEHQEEAPASAETADVIAEADIYIAYGRYAQATSLLAGVLGEEPQRNDVRLKLLELCAETRDREAFERHLAELEARCRDEETLLTARELGRQFGLGAAATGADVMPLQGAENTPQDAPPPAEVDDVLAFDLTPDEAAVSPVDAVGRWEEPALTAFDGAPRPEQSDQGTEFELELVELDGLELAISGDESPIQVDDALELALDDEALELLEVEPVRGSDELGGDLGLSFDPDRAASETAIGVESSPALSTSSEAMLAAGTDLDLDLDLELDLDAPPAEAASDDEFGFDDDGDATSTKLDLARAYIDMGDQDGARDILNEVVAEGNAEQQQRAAAMLAEL